MQQPFIPPFIHLFFPVESTSKTNPHVIKKAPDFPGLFFYKEISIMLQLFLH